MPMYTWESERFGDYTIGWIHVNAPNVKEARKLAIRRYIREFGKDYAFFEFIKDLKAKPTISKVYFTWGGG